MTNKMLKAGSRFLYLWSGINFLLAALILTSVVIFNDRRPKMGILGVAVSDRLCGSDDE